MLPKCLFGCNKQMLGYLFGAVYSFKKTRMLDTSFRGNVITLLTIVRITPIFVVKENDYDYFKQFGKLIILVEMLRSRV